MDALSEESKKETALEQAQIIRAIQDMVLGLDLPFLKKALEDMKSQHSFRDAAMILNPNPFTHAERQELNALKHKQLEYIISMAENAEAIMKAEATLLRAKSNESALSKIFK